MTCNLCSDNHAPGKTLTACYCQCHVAASFQQSPIPSHPYVTPPTLKLKQPPHTHCFCKSKDIDGIMHEVCCMCGQRRVKVK
jgi:hypothetical protein